MLPPILAHEIKQGVGDFLRATFPPAGQFFEGVLEEFLGREGSVFKGPFYSMKLPFRPGSAAPETIFPGLPLRFPPYRHQELAFTRLRSPDPRSTIIATGTGSGKTECFLYPILDHCLRHPGQRGIKAIVIYPMNALATDQARRFARAIHESDLARGRLRVGLFIGGEGEEDGAKMTGNGVITSKPKLRESPPDILLTNYKMLDFLLIRPEDVSLWALNEPDTLRYLVVDELHTFDGAQGTDLACLIRRLKRRLRTPEEHLCCVGTSATLGSEGELEELTRYAGTIFGEPFAGDHPVITEDVLTDAEFTGTSLIRHTTVPDKDDQAALNPGNYGSPAEYLAKQYALWFGQTPPPDAMDEAWRLKLGDALKSQSFFRNLLVFFRKGLVEESRLVDELALMDERFRDARFAREVVASSLSLAAHARSLRPGGGVGPFVQVRAQLWLRELSRLVSSVQPSPALGFADDLAPEQLLRHLPVMHCRECGTMGWGATKRGNEDHLNPELKAFYEAFFQREPKLCFVFPGAAGSIQAELWGSHRLCGHCLRLMEGQAPDGCSSCGNGDLLMPLLFVQETVEHHGRLRSKVACPECGSSSGLTIMGSRAASLTSVALGQGFASPFNDDKQALTFSDSVQDASHRAGFFSARTYRPVLRTALRRVLDGKAGEPTLPELATAFREEWRTKLGPEAFVGTFLPAQMEWKRDYDELRQTGALPSGSRLPHLLQRRLDWEITAEAGFNARIGRTLEKTGAAIAFPERESVARALYRAAELLKEMAGGFGSVRESTVLQTLLGLTARLRWNGGIFHPELDRYTYLSTGGKPGHWNKEADHLPKLGREGSSPVFFSTIPGGRFERLLAAGTARTWSQRWVARSLGRDVPCDETAAATAIPLFVQALTESGLWREQAFPAGKVWGLDPEQVLIAREVVQLACDTCGFGASCAPHEIDAWAGLPCLRHTCRGGYRALQTVSNYFGELYRRGDVARIHAAEHTGLLDRDEREQVERRFMARTPDRRATDPNLLSCTPTLEMGIDIGDLSTVVLCSVPPGQANYMQRIGRAGRRDGNGFNLTLANADPHDLYYWEQPLEMMAGAVSMPGVFLSAPAVLERQFIAFCMDRWMESKSPPPVVPRQLGVVLDQIDAAPDPGKFPHNFLRFCENQLAGLTTDFLDMFTANELGESSRDALRTFSKGGADAEGSFAWKILRGLQELGRERAELRERLKLNRNAIDRNRTRQPRDEALEEELTELQRSRAGLFDLVDKLNRKATFNYFTDEGLLPNYAFPEEGVTLRSIILRRKEQPDENGKFESITFEYQRPAALAIRELAPGNAFYAGGRKLTVDQISVRLSQPETWHFCDACNHAERHLADQPGLSNCPRCGSEKWPDASLLQPLLRIRQVTATQSDRSSRSYDESDQREPQFFNRRLSATFDPKKDVMHAFHLEGEGPPFGFEYLRRVTLREVNFGPEDELGARLLIGGQEIPTTGFRMCPECGKVQGARRRDELEHDISCRLRTAGNGGEPLQAVFLYREMISEAIRLLVPSVSSEDETSLYSFVAALNLGLKERFGGSIDHLQICADDSPIKGTNLRQRHLVLYDSVPGGTGYLKHLMSSPEALLDVLDLSLQRLRACPCETDEAKDGCHRCIRAYRLRYRHPVISRRRAMQLLESILGRRDGLRTISDLSVIDLDPLVESELEARFLEALREPDGFRLEPAIVRGRTGYLLRGGDRGWEVAPQVPVPVGEGIDVASRADFVLYPIRSGETRPVAVFLDGFHFHANEEAGRLRIGRDLAQRTALLQSGRFQVWSLTWNDLEQRRSGKRDYFFPYGEENSADRARTCRQFSGANLTDLAETRALSSLDLLVRYLREPDPQVWRWLSFHYAFFLGQMSALGASGQPVLDPLFHGQALPPIPSVLAPEATHYLRTKEYMDEEVIRATAAATCSRSSLTERNLDEFVGILLFNDRDKTGAPDFRRHWEGLLRFANLVQFLPRVAVISIQGIGQGYFGGLRDRLFHAPAPAPEVELSADQREELETIDPRWQVEVLRMTELGAPWPIFGNELVLPFGQTDGAVAELAWPRFRLAVLHPEQPESDANAYLNAGWTVMIPGARDDAAWTAIAAAINPNNGTNS